MRCRSTLIGTRRRDTRNRRALDRRRGGLARRGAHRARCGASSRAGCCLCRVRAPAASPRRPAAYCSPSMAPGRRCSSAADWSAARRCTLAARIAVHLPARAWWRPRSRSTARATTSRGVGTAVYLCVYNLALLASLVVLIAGNVVVFLVAWESVALLCYLLILRHHKREGVADAAFLFIALSEVGFLLIALAFAILATRTGTLDSPTMASRSARVAPGWRSAVTCWRCAASASRLAWCRFTSGFPLRTRSHRQTARRSFRAW